MVEMLQHHGVIIKLRKTRFFPARAEFVGVNVTKDGNFPAQSKHDALKGLDKPLLHSDLSVLIAFIGFYQNWIPSCESRIGRWRDHNKRERTSPWSSHKRRKSPTPASAMKTRRRRTARRIKTSYVGCDSVEASSTR
jgi:hypothetical protein